MRYSCPKCGETIEIKPPSGTCPHCDATLVAENEPHHSDPHGDPDGLPSPKRRL
ncbi:MAG TPA: hypothetical protein VMT89_18505 [Candidatus Acidoferrales bacterium]|nr:hypothetical protein [Candidatus Acidoferrales bacterium]